MSSINKLVVKIFLKKNVALKTGQIESLFYHLALFSILLYWKSLKSYKMTIFKKKLYIF